MSEIINVFNKAKEDADMGDANSQFILANMYHTIPKFKNEEGALKYYKLAAESGITEAQFRLGNIYSYKTFTSVENNLETAFNYYKLAADNGLAKAQYKVGQIYDSCDNKNEALKYYKLAANNGIIEAQLRILEIFSNDNNLDAFEDYYKYIITNNDEFNRMCIEKIAPTIKERNKKH